MSSREDKGRGGGRREVFLSAHRCPQVDVVPHHSSETGEKMREWIRTSRLDDLEMTCESEEEESISDWSEEDLSLHFSPSVILPSEDEESDPDSGFKCVDVTVETQVTGQEGLKMVPKRQIHLKKKIREQETLQVRLKDGPAAGGGAKELCPTLHQRPELLLRQHSMPASFHSHPMSSSSSDVDRMYRGGITTAGRGFQGGGKSEVPRRLQKSVSLDETKTKMASCIIKSVLSKKMQVEQINGSPSKMKTELRVLPPADQGRVKEVKAPVHVVRDLRSLVKNTYSLSFSTETTPNNYKATSFRVIGQEDSPPPTYQQAVGVKGHHKTNSTKGHVAKVAACFNQPQTRKPSHTSSHPITRERRGTQPIRRKLEDVTWPVTIINAATSPTLHPSNRAEASPNLPQRNQGHISAPGPAHQVIHPPTLLPHLGKLSYIHGPLNYIQTPTPPTLQLLRPQTQNGSENPDQQYHPPTEPPGDQEGTSRTRETFRLLPAQVGKDLVTGSALPPGALSGGPASCLEANSRCLFYVDTPPQPQRKMLLDPETGQYIQVFVSPVHSTLFPVCHLNYNPVLSVMSRQPTLALSPLYAPPCFPLTPYTPSGNIAHTSP